jgi:hypothetical protein
VRRILRKTQAAIAEKKTPEVVEHFRESGGGREYLAAASKSVCPEQSERWRKTQQRRLRRSAWPSIIAELESHRESPGSPKEEAPVTNAHRYLFNRHDCLDYKASLEAQLPTGSGLIESGHWQVLQARLKKAGTSWLPQTAEDMAQLRDLRSNHQWQNIWN